MARLPKWRPFTWVIVVINALFLIWLIGGLASVADECAGVTGRDLEACEAGTAIGAGIGAGIILTFWVLVDIILGIVWLVTKPKRRPCPVCGTELKPGVTVCPRCGYDFRAGVASQAPPPPPPPLPPPA